MAAFELRAVSSSRGRCSTKWSGNLSRISRSSRKARGTSSPCNRQTTNCRLARSVVCVRVRVAVRNRGAASLAGERYFLEDCEDGRTDGRTVGWNEEDRRKEDGESREDNPRSRVHIVRYEFPLFLGRPVAAGRRERVCYMRARPLLGDSHSELAVVVVGEPTSATNYYPLRCVREKERERDGI